jgi:hypothetical protein
MTQASFRVIRQPRSYVSRDWGSPGMIFVAKPLIPEAGCDHYKLRTLKDEQGAFLTDAGSLRFRFPTLGCNRFAVTAKQKRSAA